MRLLVFVLVFIGFGFATPSLANECIALWKERNSLFNAKGYCFKSGLGLAYFGRAGCRASMAPLTASEDARVKALLAREARLGCKAQKEAWTLADLKRGAAVAEDPVANQQAYTTQLHNAPTGNVKPHNLDREQIRELQIRLGTGGFFSGVINGQFGSDTGQAVLDYAAVNGLDSGVMVAREVLSHLQRAELAAQGGQKEMPPDPRLTEIDRLRDAAFKGTTAGLALSRTDRNPRDYLPSGMKLLTQNGTPVLSFREQWVGDRFETALSFACAGEDQIEIVAMVQRSRLSEATSLRVGDRHELLLRPYDGRKRLQIPAKLVGWAGSPGQFAKFKAMASVRDGFFRAIEDSSNLQIDIKENGRNSYYSSGGKLDGVELHLNPLLDNCTGYTPPKKDPPPTVSFWTPGAAEIKWALQAEADARLATMDRMAEGCDQVSQNGDPFAAMACILSTVSGVNSETVALKVNAVELERCVRSKGEERAYCNYRVDADVSGSSTGAAIVGAANDAAKEIGSYGWGSFDKSTGRWMLERVYRDCDLTQTEINCTYTD